MASIQEIKRRIKAVTSTSQIMKAMELVSATKMRKSQEVALLSRPYALEALRILGELTYRTGGTYVPELMRSREVRKTAVVLVASDRGLAGAFNSNVFRGFEKWIEKEKHNSRFTIHNSSFIAVGKKAEEYLLRKEITPKESYTHFGDSIEVEQVRPLTDTLVKGYLNRSWDRVVMISMHFRTTLRQEVLTREVLPIDIRTVRETVREVVPEYGRYSGTEKGLGSLTFDTELDFEYLIEPTPQALLEALPPKLLEIVLYDVILEANASEHSARMVAMKNASENASELKGELTLEYNKSRQANITKEIAEIVGGAEALQM